MTIIVSMEDNVDEADAQRGEEMMTNQTNGVDYSSR
jgi:hypothetical protein